MSKYTCVLFSWFIFCKGHKPENYPFCEKKNVIVLSTDRNDKLEIYDIFTSPGQQVSNAKKRTLVETCNPVKGNIFQYFAPKCMQESELNNWNLPWYSESFECLFEIRGGKVYTIPTILRLVCVALKHDDYCVCFARQRTLTKTPAYIVYTQYRISCRCLKDGTIATWPYINVYNVNQFLGSNVIYVKCNQRIKALSNLEI